jgi:drug/metabolite transporter superfamily protein YnfA
MGIQNGIGNLAGIVQPVVTGLIIDRTGHYGLAFAASGLVAVVGLFSWLGLVRRVSPITWSDQGLAIAR